MFICDITYDPFSGRQMNAHFYAAPKVDAKGEWLPLATTKISVTGSLVVKCLVH
jgi:hypothetical protein